MKNLPIVVEEVLNASVPIVWQAITDRDRMKDWYFELKEFRAEAGFEFQFYGGSDEKQYLHLCRITEVKENSKLSYTWRYEDYDGESLVTFELFSETNRTRVKLTHSGLETFPRDNSDFAKENFMEGWKHIIGNSLKEYVEKNKE